MHLFAAVVTALAVTSVDAGCCVAKQFTAREGFLVGYANANGSTIGAYTMSVKAAYDAENEIISYETKMYEHGGWEKSRYIQSFKNHRTYLIADGECTVGYLKGPFREMCIPDNAEKVSTYTLGLEDHHLDVATYMFKKRHLTVYLSMHKDHHHCVPVSGAYVSYPVPVSGAYAKKSSHWASMTTFIVGDVELGIKDKSTFRIPDSCKEVSSREYDPFKIPFFEL